MKTATSKQVAVLISALGVRSVRPLPSVASTSVLVTVSTPDHDHANNHATSLTILSPML